MDLYEYVTLHCNAFTSVVFEVSRKNFRTLPSKVLPVFGSIYKASVEKQDVIRCGNTVNLG